MVDIGAATWTTVERALDHIPAHARIMTVACCGTPTTVLRALSERCAGRDWTVWSGLLLDDAGLHDAVRAGAIKHVTWHVADKGRDLVGLDNFEHVPLRASRIAAMLTATEFDVALVRVTPPDADGWCSFGPSVSYAQAAVDSARLCIAEVDPSLPRTLGDSQVHISALDILVESTSAPPEYTTRAPDDVSRAIARHALALIPDAPVLQLGIGGVPSALVEALIETRASDLRFVGMGIDGMVELAEHGLLAAPGRGMLPIESPDLLGTNRLMTFADENPTIGMYPSTVAHDAVHLAHNDRLVSLNTAVEIDLSGQVNSEFVHGRQISGIGGSLDFVEAAMRSPGGVRIVALPSTTARGHRSRIVPSIETGAAVTIPRGMVDAVVTEHGVARLDGLSLRERAEALIQIAAPQHRDALTDAMKAATR